VSSSKSAWNLLIVLLVWASMLIVALGLVRRFGTKTLPQSDEVWALYDAGPGIHLHWLWKTWAEHRLPLAKFIWQSVLQLSGYNFRTGNFLTVLALAILAFAMIWTSRQIRGHTIIADAFFPLVLLNFGQAQVFLWWWQVNVALASIAVSVLLLLLVLYGNNLKPRQAGLIAGSLVLLVLCGPGALPYVPALAMWLIIWTAMKWPSLNRLQRRNCVVALSPMVVAFAMLAYYFVDYTPYFPTNNPPTLSNWPQSPGPLASATASVQVLGVSLGTATKPYAMLSGFVVLALVCVTLAILISIWLKRPSERSRALALIMFLGAAAVLVLVMGNSRAGMGLDYIYQGHYLPLLAPALCCIYFAWEIRGGNVGRCVQFGMLGVLAILAPLNLQQAIHAGRDLAWTTAEFERDVWNGVPAFVLAERHFSSDIVPRAAKLDVILRDLKANGIGIFSEIRDDPPFQVETLDPKDAALDGMILHDGIASSAVGSKGMSSLTFVLPRPRRIYAVRLRYAYVKTGSNWPKLRAYWRNSAVQEFNNNAAVLSIVSGPDQPTWAHIGGKIQTNARVRTERSLTIWVDATIDQFRIYPDAVPCEFRLSGIELLTPIEEESRRDQIPQFAVRTPHFL
jgi:hypothetical protein